MAGGALVTRKPQRELASSKPRVRIFAADATYGNLFLHSPALSALFSCLASMDIICPSSPTIWEGNDFSACFENITVLGFGANVVTIVAVLSLAFAKGKDGRTRSFRIGLLGKIILHILPALGVCLSFLELLLLLKNHVDGYNAKYHEWLFRCSQFVSWMVIMVVSKFEYWFSVFCNPIVCYWWIMRLLLLIPHLKTMISSCEAMACIRETSSFSAEIMFCLFINIVRALHSCTDQRKFDSLEGPLLSGTRKTEDCHTMNSDWSIANCWDVLTFKFVNSMMVHGITRQLDFEDLVELPCELIPSSCHSALLSCWVDEQNKHGSGSSLFRVICRAYGWPYLRLGLLKVLNDAIGFLGPVLLNKLIQFLQQGSGYMDGYILAISMGLTSTIKSFLDTQYSFHLMKLRLKLRSSIMTMIYRKCLCISLAERSKFSEGEVQTFMSIDSDRTVNLCNSFHDMWSLPLQIGVALYLLYTQVNFAFISGLAITILLIPVNKWISTLIANATTHMMKQKDERIRSAGEFLTYIRTLKIYSWEHLFTDRMMVIRQKEVKHLSVNNTHSAHGQTRKYLDAWCVFFWATTPTLFSLFTFGVFTLMGHPLDAATVFTCVALFNTLISPLNSFPWVINGLIDAFISIGRLSKFLSSSEQKSIYDQPSDACTSCVISDMSSNPMAVVFQDAHCVWSSNYVEGQSAVLKGIMLDLPKGLFVAVIGEVGSGKSSLLNSILGEMQIICGSVRSYGSMAYVPQVPWILSGSLRDNILFGEKIDAERYAEVLHVCALDVDISRMVGGDQAYIGEKGVNLSGGQRARLALARAVYRDCDIYLLDDILSAVDSQVACWILQKTILGSLMNKKTRLLCTHNIQAIASADMIIVMDKGHVKWAGTSSCFLLSPHSTIYTLRDSDSSSQFLKKESCTSVSGELKSHRLLESDNIAISDEAQDIVETEMRKEGRVELNVYKSYATFASWPVVILICVSAVLMQASRNGNDLWLSYWVDATTGTENTRFYLAVLVIFSVANSSLTLARAFSFAYGGLRAAVQAHNELLQKLIDAPVRFFDQNPSGRILNRLSSDLYMIDDSLPFILNILIANFCGLLGIVVVLSYTQILFLLLLFPLWYFYNKLQFYYRSTSRELRRLDSVSRSPIYSSFTETLDGSPTIRAFNSQALFMARFTEQVTLYQKTSYSESTTSLWLSLRLQLLAAIIISFIAVMAVVGSRADFSLSFTTPGLVGLALSYAAPTVSFLSSFLTSFTETEKEMISVERMLQYMDIPQEELQGSQSLTPDWPMHGHIRFEHVTLKYLPSLPPALNDVSFDLAGGLQVGIVGRTGAGKSSIINALFRLAPICSGQIVVDGLNVADVAVRTLRERFAVVPQSPFLFEGTLRDNLDPFGRASDLEIWEALEKCHVKADVQSAGGLDICVKEGNLSFSVGQRQLICLARALIKSSKILCLDECTANVDTPTASLLQKTISNECKGMTVLTIAHRISVVLNMDSILVFDHGILVEQGNPQVLLQDASSKFWGFARASVM